MTTYWLFKTNPATLSYDDLERTDVLPWQIGRGAAARKLIHVIGPCSLSFVFHTGSEQAIVGVAEVLSKPYSDPLLVDVAARGRLGRPISLAELQQWPEFAAWECCGILGVQLYPFTPKYGNGYCNWHTARLECELNWLLL